MTDWSQLSHAYGTAEDIPGLLDRLEPDPRSPVWNDLWSSLCHQGTVYTASYAALTEQTLDHPAVAAGEATNYVYLLQALLAFEDVEVWGTRLDGIVDEEYEVCCPECEADNFVVFGKYGHFTTLDAMYMRNSDADATRVPLLPAQPTEPTGLARRLYERAAADGYPDVAEQLTYVFGHARCAQCGVLFGVEQAIVDRWRP